MVQAGDAGAPLLSKTSGPCFYATENYGMVGCFCIANIHLNVECCAGMISCVAVFISSYEEFQIAMLRVD